jgi:energy-coupling factor transporter ATP-binding protein EcfA2
MKLRYLRLSNLEPLKNISVSFGYEPILGHDCAIRFVVGINGSGKTRLLQAISEIFLRLGRRELPPFPVTMVYDLGHGDSARTIYLKHVKDAASQTVFIEFNHIIEEVDWDDLDSESELIMNKIKTIFTEGELPGYGSIGSYLPKLLLAYTSGASSKWEKIFNPKAEGMNLNIKTPTIDNERPLSWDYIKEMEYQKTTPIARTTIHPGEFFLDSNLLESDNENQTVNTMIFISHKCLSLVVLSVVLEQAQKDFDAIETCIDEKSFVEEIDRSLNAGNRMHNLRGILNELDWLWPITLKLHIIFRPNNFTKRQADLIKKLYKIATSVVREPEPGEIRYLIFDLRRPLAIDGSKKTISTATALIEAIIGPHQNTAFNIFRSIYELYYNNILIDITIAFRKRNSENILLYDWLSDGEQLFLARMSLFHLIHGQNDALIILDEPDTHFNDYWKREIVDIIDENMQSNSSDIIISTHSSIALTDVFDTEIITLRKDNGDGAISAIRTPIRSFGASPSEIMLNIFNAPESVGQRATEYLDLVLLIAAYPESVESIWMMKETKQSIIESAQFQRLKLYIKTLPHQYGNDQQVEERLYTIINALYKETQEFYARDTITVIDVLSYLEDKIGPGYYQFEFRRRLRALRDGNKNAA